MKDRVSVNIPIGAAVIRAKNSGTFAGGLDEVLQYANLYTCATPGGCELLLKRFLLRIYCASRILSG